MINVKLDKEAHPDVDCSCKSEDWWGSAYIRSLHQCKNLHLTKLFVSVSSPKISLCLLYVFVIQVLNVCILTHEVMRPFYLLFSMNEFFKTRLNETFLAVCRIPPLHRFIRWFMFRGFQKQTHSTARRQEQRDLVQAECTLK